MPGLKFKPAFLYLKFGSDKLRYVVITDIYELIEPITTEIYNIKGFSQPNMKRPT